MEWSRVSEFTIHGAQGRIFLISFSIANKLVCAHAEEKQPNFPRS